MKKNVIRLLMSLVAILSSTCMLAENKLSIVQCSDDSEESVDIDGYKFAVMLDNSDEVSSLQFNLVIPDELMVVDRYTTDKKYPFVYPNTERFNPSQDFYCTPNAARNNFLCAVFALRNDTFIGTHGAIAYFWLKGKNNTIDFNKPIEGLKLENIKLSTFDGRPVPCDKEWGDDVVVIPEIKVTSTSEKLTVVPGSTFTLPIVLTNSELVQGLQFDLQLPAGFTLGSTFGYTDRVSVNGKVGTPTVNTEKNIYRLMLLDLKGAYVIRNTGTGVIFNCEVTAPKTIEDNSSIIIGDVVASNDALSFPGQGVQIKIVDEKAAYDSANATIDNLQAALDDAKSTIEKDCPLVADNFKGEDIQSSIDALKQDVDNAYASGTLTDNYETVMAPASAIETSIAKLLEDAKAAQSAAEAAEAAEAQRVADNIAKYNADIAALDALQKNLDDTVIIIDADYADYKDQAAIDAVQKQINDARSAADAAFAAVEKEGEYKSTLDEASINTAIDNLLTAAEAAKAEADKKADEDAAQAEQLRKDENKAAYDAVMAELNKLYASYRATIAEIQANYKPYEDVSAELALRNALDNEKDAIEYAYKAVEKEGKFEYDLDAETLQAQIDKLLADAKALAEKTENDRVAANQAAYDAVIDQLEALKAANNAAVEKILAEYPEYKAVTTDSRAIDDAIAEAKDQARKALDAVATEGEFNYTPDYQAIQDMINTMLANAEATGVEAIIADVEAGNAYVFTLDGKQHARPVNGEVNIIVRRNGEKSKVFVK